MKVFECQLCLHEWVNSKIGPCVECGKGEVDEVKGGHVFSRMTLREINTILSKQISRTYFVLWDCECQCELMRGSEEEVIKHANMFGGGNYNIYECLEDHKIIKVESRQFVDGDHEKGVSQDLRITMESTYYENKE